MFGVKEKNVYLVTAEQMKPLNHSVQNSKRFENRLNRCREIATRTLISGAQPVSVAALPSPPPKEGGCSFTTPMLVELAESARASVRRD